MFAPNDEPVRNQREVSATEPTDAAIRAWDPALWALYLTELAERQRKAFMN